MTDLNEEKRPQVKVQINKSELLNCLHQFCMKGKIFQGKG